MGPGRGWVRAGRSLEVQISLFKSQRSPGLRRQQIEAAKKGNATMLIWLGKQLLEQSDKAETASQSDLEGDGPREAHAGG